MQSPFFKVVAKYQTNAFIYGSEYALYAAEIVFKKTTLEGSF